MTEVESTTYRKIVNGLGRSWLALRRLVVWLFTPMPPRPCKVCGRSDGEMCADCANHWGIK